MSDGTMQYEIQELVDRVAPNDHIYLITSLGDCAGTPTAALLSPLNQLDLLQQVLYHPNVDIWHQRIKADGWHPSSSEEVCLTYLIDLFDDGVYTILETFRELENDEDPDVDSAYGDLNCYEEWCVLLAYSEYLEKCDLPNIIER